MRARGTRGGGLVCAGAAAAILTALCVTDARGARAACAGDCNGDGQVAINELVTGVNIALETAAVEACAAFDVDGGGGVTVNELIAGVNGALEGCPAEPPTPTPTEAAVDTPTATPTEGVATTAGIVFNGEANRLNAYEASAGFLKQTVIQRAAQDPNGRDINAQICFTRGPQGQLRFIAGEDTDQGSQHLTAGWGLFELTGTRVGEFGWTQINKFIPTYQAGEEAENYGCGFLSDGRLVTTDVGNQASGNGTGQLIMWFPPLDGTGGARYCKLDIAIGTAQQIAVDDQDRIYVSSARDNQQGAAQGVYRYTGAFPTSDASEDGCGRVDPTGAPLVSDGRIAKALFIPASASHIQTPAGIVIKPDGGFYVSSVLNGVIAEFDAAGAFVRRVLQPPAGSVTLPWPTGNPLGIGLASDGTLYYADIGLVVGPGGIGPGRDLGTVRRIRFVDGEPQPPETMDTGLNFPDGIGVLELE